MLSFNFEKLYTSNYISERGKIMTISQTFDAEMAAKFLFTSEATILQLAESGDLPGAKIGKSLVLDSNLVHEYLLMQINIQTIARKFNFDSKYKPSSGRTSTALGDMKSRQGKKYPVLPDLPNTTLN